MTNLVGLALELVLQNRKVRGAVCRGDHHLAIDNGGPRADQEGGISNPLEALSPVIAAACEYPDTFVDDVKLDAVAVELDLMQPALAARHLSYRRRQAGSMKPG
jgi:hypothetical protein